jgi:hypothetical protein
MKPSRAARYYYLRFLRLKDDPVILARGVAIGIFIGITPTLPLHTLLIIFFASILRGNLITALLSATVVSNPFTFVPQYYFSWFAGNLLLPGKLSWERIRTTLDMLLSDLSFGESLAAITHLGRDAVLVMVLGGILLALPFSLAGYVLSLKLFVKIRNKRRQKHVLL